jgi:membrane protease YdiL (CAAX protease family)
MASSEHADGTRPHAGPLAAWCVLALIQAGLGLATYQASGGTSLRDPLFTWSFVGGALVQFSILLALTVMIAYGYGHPAAALGVRRFAARWVWIALGVILASLLVGAVMEIFTNAAKEQGLSPDRWHSDRVAQFAVSAAMVVFLGPLAEELFYRGLGVRVLAFARPAVAICATAIAFALAHGVPAAFPTLIVFGAGLAWVRLRSDSLWPGYIAHATYNALALGLAALSF